MKIALSAVPFCFGVRFCSVVESLLFSDRKSKIYDVRVCASEHFSLSRIYSFFSCVPYSGLNVWLAGSICVLWLCTKNRCCWSSAQQNEVFVTVLPLLLLKAAAFVGGCQAKKNEKKWKKWENLFRAPCSHFSSRMMLGKMRIKLRRHTHTHLHECALHSHQNVRLLLLLCNNNTTIRVARPAWSIAEYAYKHNRDFIVFAFHSLFSAFFPFFREKKLLSKTKTIHLPCTLFRTISLSPFLHRSAPCTK